MKILFAMDLIGGKCVRLVKGDFSRMTAYSDDPEAKVEELIAEGAQDFHFIDLDGARTGETVHREIIKKVRARVHGYMEVGGGIRRVEDIIDYSNTGIDGVIVGTRALEDGTFFQDLASFKNIILGLDLYEGRPMVRGWETAVERDVQEILLESERINVMAILCTSIARDGTLSGPDYEAFQGLLTMTGLPLIASGGVTHAEDLKRLRDMGAWGAVVGKAIYEGVLKVEEAIQYAD